MDTQSWFVLPLVVALLIWICFDYYRNSRIDPKSPEGLAREQRRLIEASNKEERHLRKQRARYSLENISTQIGWLWVAVVILCAYLFWSR